MPQPDRGLSGGGVVATDVTLSDSTVSGNTASGGGRGGGIYDGGTVTLTNSTLSGNIAGTGDGGGIYAPTITLTDSTVGGNTAGLSAGGIYIASGATSVNTILADNNAAAGPDCVGALTSAGHNLIGNNNGCTFSSLGSDLVGTAASPIDPLLAALANNGGPTRTLTLLPGSPAIGQGDGATCRAAQPGGAGGVDQRGYARPTSGACDIGAYEFGATAPATSIAVSGPASAGFGQPVVLSATLSTPGYPAASPFVPTGTVTFYDGPPAGNVVLPYQEGAPATHAVPVPGSALPESVTCTLAAGLSAGTHTIYASYGGDMTFLASTTASPDQTLSLTIVAATTTTAQGATAPFSATDQAVTLSATVASPGGPVNEGTVTFTVKNGAATVGAAVTSGTVTNGAASASYTLPGGTPAGPYTIQAVYNPGPDFLTSSGSNTLTVGQAATTIAVTGAPNPADIGQPVTFTAHVAAPGGGTPTGTVTFSDTFNGVTTPVGGPVTLANGTASITVPGLPRGGHTITAVYSGDANFTGNSTQAPQLVETVRSCQVAGTVDSATAYAAVYVTSVPATLGQFIFLRTTQYSRLVVRNPVITSCVAGGTPSATIAGTAEVGTHQFSPGDGVLLTVTTLVPGGPVTRVTVQDTSKPSLPVYTFVPPTIALTVARF